MHMYETQQTGPCLGRTPKIIIAVHPQTTHNNSRKSHSMHISHHIHYSSLHIHARRQCPRHLTKVSPTSLRLQRFALHCPKSWSADQSIVNLSGAPFSFIHPPSSLFPAKTDTKEQSPNSKYQQSIIIHSHASHFLLCRPKADWA